MSADKEQATRLADALRQSFPAFGDGTRSDRERLAVDAAALLERWPDAVEPVARVSWNDIGHISWRTNVMLPDGTPLYTAPAAQPVKPGGEPVASMIRHRAGTPASRAWDGKVHWHEWSEWSPATLAHGRAVTDPSRNPTEDSEWQMQPLYAAQPDQSARIADRKWLDSECLDGGCQSLKWRERIAALEAENAALKVEMSWPIPCHIATTTYRFDGERQVHIPQLLLEFAAVPVGAPNTAQGWADRDSVARLIADATTPADATARIAALEAALAERERPTVAIGAKASEWKTLSPQAQALIQQAAQKAVDRWSEQQKLDGAARAATPLVPLGASDLDRAHGGIDERIAALEEALAERDRAIEQARVALEGLLRGCKRSTIQGLTGWHEKSMPSSEALDAGQDALRAIEEVRK